MASGEDSCPVAEAPPGQDLACTVSKASQPRNVISESPRAFGSENSSCGTSSAGSAWTSGRRPGDERKISRPLRPNRQNLDYEGENDCQLGLSHHSNNTVAEFTIKPTVLQRVRGRCCSSAPASSTPSQLQWCF